MKNTITLLSSIFIFNVSFSQVEQNQHRLDEVYKECCNENHGEYGAAKCAISLSKEWDKEMNKYYKGLMNILDTNAQNDLKQAQDQWTKYRDLESTFSSSLYDMQGTMYIRLSAYRSMRIIRTRAMELKSYYWIRTESDDPEVYESYLAQIQTQANRPASELPTPDSLFFNRLDSSNRWNAEYVIEKYIEAYFSITNEKKAIEKAPDYHTELPGQDCRFRTEYNNRVTIEEDYGCNSYFQTTTIEFDEYSVEEVKEIIKILLPKEYNKEVDNGDSDNHNGWDESGQYYNYNDNCTLKIVTDDNKIRVSYGCSC